MSSGILAYVCLSPGGVLPQPFYWTQREEMARAYVDLNGGRVIGVEVPFEEDLSVPDFIFTLLVQTRVADGLA